MKFSFIQPGLSEGALEMCPNAWPPLGLLYCATVLSSEGIEVSVLDQKAKGFSTRQVLSWAKKEDPNILGLSVLGSSSKEAGKIARMVKEDNPNIWIVFGNYHPTFNAERILRKYSHVDIIVRGEGEYTSVELARCLQRKENLRKIQGITYKDKNGRIIATPERPLINNVDSLPFPNRRLVDCEYVSRIFGITTVTKKFTSLLSSRGCPFQCSFCACQKFARGRWRPRSVENIIEELEYLCSEGYQQFLFVDDNFTINPQRVVKLCRTLRKRGMEIEWFCDSRVDNCGFETFKEIVRAGCKTLYFGMESANQRILDYYKKNITPEQSKKAARNARKAGVDVIVGSFIVGAPNETREEVKKTLQFAQQTDIDVPSFNILCAPVGSPLWIELVAKGLIDEDRYWEEGVFVPKVVSTAVPFEEISEMIYKHFRAFYLNPKRLFSEGVKMFSSSFRLGLIFNNLGHLGQIIKTVKRGVQFK
ncbi:MAG: radical SAM protein [Candidatus Bathyarchaeota archaeon]|nr:MAG: radical SAM protein [Candidatus Bathyarchaeota archaeon]